MLVSTNSGVNEWNKVDHRLVIHPVETHKASRHYYFVGTYHLTLKLPSFLSDFCDINILK